MWVFSVTRWISSLVVAGFSVGYCQHFYDGHVGGRRPRLSEVQTLFPHLTRSKFQFQMFFFAGKFWIKKWFIGFDDYRLLNTLNTFWSLVILRDECQQIYVGLRKSSIHYYSLAEVFLVSTPTPRRVVWPVFRAQASIYSTILQRGCPFSSSFHGPTFIPRSMEWYIFQPLVYDPERTYNISGRFCVHSKPQRRPCLNFSELRKI